jgi:hypothetical protein
MFPFVIPSHSSRGQTGMPGNAMTRRPYLFALLARAALLACCLAASTQAAQESAARAIQAEIEAYEQAVRANTQRIMEAATEEERNRHRTSIPSAAPHAARVLEWIEKSDDHEDMVRGLTWLLIQCHSLPEGKRALALASARFSTAPGLASAYRHMEFHPRDRVEPLLKVVLEKFPTPPSAPPPRLSWALLAGRQHLGTHHHRVGATSLSHPPLDRAGRSHAPEKLHTRGNQAAADGGVWSGFLKLIAIELAEIRKNQ